MIAMEEIVCGFDQPIYQIWSYCQRRLWRYENDTNVENGVVLGS